MQQVWSLTEAGKPQDRLPVLLPPAGSDATEAADGHERSIIQVRLCPGFCRP